ncbi:hypothetical protein V8E51_008415 [Hyaloscypha variabilis]
MALELIHSFMHCHFPALVNLLPDSVDIGVFIAMTAKEISLRYSTWSFDLFQPIHPSSLLSQLSAFLKNPGSRIRGPHLTYEEVFKHLASTGTSQHIVPEGSMSFTPDGYLPKSWRVLTELDVIPPVVKREGSFLHETIAAIQTKVKAGETRAAEANKVANGNSTAAEKGYGMHSAGTTTAAKQNIVNIKEGFELHLEDATLAGRRHRKTLSQSKEGNGGDTAMVSNTPATGSSGNNGVGTGVDALQQNNNTSTTSHRTANASQAPSPALKPYPVPSENFLFNPKHIPHTKKYLRLLESGFTTPWQLNPLGASSFQTIHGDASFSPTNYDPATDARAATVLVSFIYLPALPITTRHPLLESFLLTGPKFVPDPQYIITKELIRGDTLFIPPLTIHRFEYRQDTLTANGLFMLRSNLRLALESWMWDCLSTFKRNYSFSLELLDVMGKELCRDPIGTGWLGEGYVEIGWGGWEGLMEDFGVVWEAVMKEWMESGKGLEGERRGVEGNWVVERERRGRVAERDPELRLERVENGDE